jgi:hypothetical protein
MRGKGNFISAPVTGVLLARGAERGKGRKIRKSGGRVKKVAYLCTALVTGVLLRVARIACGAEVAVGNKRD